MTYPATAPTLELQLLQERTESLEEQALRELLEAVNEFELMWQKDNQLRKGDELGQYGARMDAARSLGSLVGRANTVRTLLATSPART